MLVRNSCANFTLVFSQTSFSVKLSPVKQARVVSNILTNTFSGIFLAAMGQQNTNKTAPSMSSPRLFRHFVNIILKLVERQRWYKPRSVQITLFMEPAILFYKHTSYSISPNHTTFLQWRGSNDMIRLNRVSVMDGQILQTQMTSWWQGRQWWWHRRWWCLWWWGPVVGLCLRNSVQ